MGQSLSSPVTSKQTSVWVSKHYYVTATNMQGWRVHMEDAHTCLLEIPGDPKAAYFSVFDGHGGTRVAKYASQHLHEHITAQTEYARNDVKEAVRKAFLCLDAEMQSEMTSMGHQKSPTVANCSPRSGLPVSAAGGTGGGTYHHRSAVAGLKSSDTSSNKFINPGDELAGSTGNIVLIRDGVLYCGNAGDSRAVCSCMGVADALSSDHKPTLRGEKERIQAAGGWVDANRVNGNLALSRAFGDFVFKRNPVQNAENQIVSANPEVSVRRLKEDEDEFIVLCCDGIWDVMTNQEVISFVRLRLSCGMDPSKVCEELMMRCLAPDCHSNGLGCDNMTVVLVCLLYGRPLSDLQRRCDRPCAAGAAADIVGA